jgi:hypothetical protein
VTLLAGDVCRTWPAGRLVALDERHDDGWLCTVLDPNEPEPEAFVPDRELSLLWRHGRFRR